MKARFTPALCAVVLCGAVPPASADVVTAWHAVAVSAIRDLRVAPMHFLQPKRNRSR